MVTIDFITKLPKTPKQHDAIMVMVAKFTKVAHFILIKKTHKATNIADIYMKEVSRLHGVPKAIVQTEIPSSHQTFGNDCLRDLGKI